MSDTLLPLAQAATALLERADSHHLPQPQTIYLDGADEVHLYFRDLVDLTTWALAAAEVIETAPLGDTGKLHHEFTGALSGISCRCYTVAPAADQ